MENERNNILGSFKYGFCDLKGALLDNNDDLESELGWNEEAISLLKEIYPVIGKMNLDLAEERKSVITVDEYDFDDGLLKDLKNSKWQERYGKNDFRSDDRLREVRPMEALTDFSDYNDIIIGLRSLLYSEIELRNHNIDDVDYNEDVSNILFESGLQLTNLFAESFERIEFEESSYADFLMFGFHISLPRLRGLVNFINTRIDRCRDLEPIDRLPIVFECLEAIKYSGLVKNADRLWAIFLLNLYRVILFDDELMESKNSDIQNLDSKEYKGIVRKNYEIIDKGLRELQHRNIDSILKLCSLNSVSSRNFYKHDIIRRLYDALNSKDDLREIYLTAQKKCFAAMYNRDTKKRYAAISGGFDPNMYVHSVNGNNNYYKKLVSILKRIMDDPYEVIEFGDEVKYYYKKRGKSKSITAQKYINSPYPVDKQLGKRMFSCCERKLSTRLERGCEHDFYVKYAPCELCDRMITEETKNRAHFINVFYAGKIKDLSKKKIRNFDKSADDANQNSI